MTQTRDELFYRDVYAKFNLSGFDVGIFGCGMLGAPLALALARLGFRNFSLYDMDNVEPRNLTNQPYFDWCVGYPKAEALASLITQIDPSASVYTSTERFTGNAPWRFPMPLLFDCFDNPPSRRALSTWAVQRTPFLLHLGVAPGFGEVTWERDYQPPQDDDSGIDPCEIPYSSVHAQIVVSAAVESVMHMLGSTFSEYRNYHINGLRVFQSR